MLPLLKRAALGETRILDAEKLLADEFGLTQEERGQLLPSGKQRVLHNRAHWAKFYLMKAELVSFPKRGAFVATDVGRQLLAKAPNQIDLELLKEYPSFKEFYNGDHPTTTRCQQIQLGQCCNPARRNQLRKSKSKKHSLRFNRPFVPTCCSAFFKIVPRSSKNSSSIFWSRWATAGRPDAATQLGRSGDGGVDGVINEDRLGLDRVYVQAKRYAEENVVGRPAVQNFVGSLVGMGATKGVFVTTSKYSGEAIEFARHLQQRVILIDGRRLTELMIEHGVGVRLNRAIEFKKLDEDYFDEEE